MRESKTRRGRDTSSQEHTHGHPYLQGRGPKSEKIEVHESAGGQERVKQRGGHCMLPRQIELRQCRPCAACFGAQQGLQRCLC